MKNRNVLFGIVSILISLVFIYPWLIQPTMGIEHDTFFHLSRIEGLATSLKNYQFLPSIYPYKNNNFGYGNALFYCDLLLLPSSLLYLSGISLMRSYQFALFYVTCFSCFTMMKLLERFTDKNINIFVVTIAYCFANYRITDAYVRSALGELTALIFIPLLCLALYELLERKDISKRYLFTLSLVGLVLSHNITFIFGLVIIFIFLFIYRKQLTSELLRQGLLGGLYAFLLTAWYTLPMLEQLLSQQFYLNYYGAYSDLGGHSLSLIDYISNVTIFGMSGQDYELGSRMVLNIGLFLTILPLFYFKDRSNYFVKSCLYVGLVFLLLPLKYIPWDYLFFIRIIQFPWRLLTIAIVLLCIPAVKVLDNYISNKTISIIFLVILLAEGIFHLYPILNRNLVITPNTTYQDIIEGRVVNPYYSATYKRVECAGGDYIPMGSPDFREYTTAIKLNDVDTDITYQKDYLTLTFEIDEPGTYKLPISWYKGYQVYHDDSKVETFYSEDKMVSFKALEKGMYVCKYDGTLLQKFSYLLTCLTILFMTFKHFTKNKHNK